MTNAGVIIINYSDKLNIIKNSPISVQTGLWIVMLILSNEQDTMTNAGDYSK